MSFDQPRAVRSVAAGHAPGRCLNRVRIVGCEQDSGLIAQVSAGEIAAIVAEDTYRMGHEAVELIAAFHAGKPMLPRTIVSPLVITRENVNSVEAGLLAGL